MPPRRIIDRMSTSRTGTVVPGSAGAEQLGPDRPAEREAVDPNPPVAAAIVTVEPAASSTTAAAAVSKPRRVNGP